MDIAGVVAGEDTRFQELLNARGDQLWHFVYLFRSPIFVGTLPFATHRPSIIAYNLSRCTNLQSFYTSMNMVSLAFDLGRMLCPTLSSLQRGQHISLRQVVITIWVLYHPERHLEKDDLRKSFDQFQEAVLQLRNQSGLSDVVFRLLYGFEGEDGQTLVAVYTNALTKALPQLSKLGIDVY